MNWARRGRGIYNGANNTLLVLEFFTLRVVIVDTRVDDYHLPAAALRRNTAAGPASTNDCC
jgi:hypothetical protein